MFGKTGFLSETDLREAPSGIDSELWKLATAPNEWALKLISEIRIHFECQPEILGTMYFLRVFSDYQAMLLVGKKGMVPQATIMLRTELEALFGLAAIAKEPSFWKELYGHEPHQKKRVLNKLKKFRRNDTDDGSQLSNIDCKLKECSEEIEQQNARPLTTEQIAEKAGLQDLYNTVYPWCSLEVHVSPRTLETAYIDNKEQGEILELKFGPDYVRVQIVVATGADCLLLAIVSLSEIFKVDVNEKLSIYRSDLQQFLNSGHE